MPRRPPKSERRAASDSLPQREAEAAALEIVAATLGVPALLANHKVPVGTAQAIVDGFFEDESHVVIVECNSRVGRMKTATKNKVKNDALKMLTIRQANARQWRGKAVRCVFLFVDDAARKSFGPKSWAEAAFGIHALERIVCELTHEKRQALEAAQKRQDLRNDG